MQSRGHSRASRFTETTTASGEKRAFGPNCQDCPNVATTGRGRDVASLPGRTTRQRIRTVAEPIARASRPRRLWMTGVLAAVVVLDAAYYAFCLAQSPSRLIRPGAALASDFGLWSFMRDRGVPVPTTPGAVAVAVVLCTAVGFAAYAGLVLLHWNRADRRATWLIAGMAGVAFAISALAMPTTNTDVYDYILFGRVASEHQEDPHVRFPDEFPDDPIYQYSSHQYTGKQDNKLPAWTLLTIGLAEVGGDGPVSNVLLYRSALAGLNLATLGLIAFIVARIRPQATTAAVALFGLNPIVAFLGPSKTDSLMAFWLVVGAACLVAGRRRLAAAGIVLSMFVKLITLPLAAVYWLREIRLGRARAVLGDVAIAAAVVLLLYAPFSRGFDLLVDHLSLLRGGGDNVHGPLRAVAVVLFVLFIAGVGLTRTADHLSLFRGWAVVALAFAVLLSRPALSWYLIVPIAAVAIACDRRTTLALIPVTAGSFLLSTWRLQNTRAHELPTDTGMTVLVVLAGLAVLVALALWLWSRPRKAEAVEVEEPERDDESRPLTVARSA
jgi:hypothetical protein